MFPPPPVDVRPEVSAAIQGGRPAVGLVSAMIAHSLPWPANLQAARQAEEAARRAGAALAVVAVWNGRLTAGLGADEVEALARGASQLRASRRDLATAISRKLTAATTVASSMYICQRAGIRVLATGAIGGATRTTRLGEEEWGVSADLAELSSTPVAVVCAGARALADQARTVEALDSARVPVIGFGTDTFPTFFLRLGGQPVSVRADTAGDVAALLAAHWGLGGAGAVVAQPAPSHLALTPEELSVAQSAVQEQGAQTGLRGKDLPPLLMGRLDRLTGGKALRAYQGILTANAELAARVAGELLALARTPAPGV